MIVFGIILVVAALGYAGLIGAFAWGFRRVRRAPLPPAPATWPLVSVIVPARNEEANIAACLHALLANDYPARRFEVIVVDDFSDDATAALVQRLQHRYERVPAGLDDEPDAPPLRLLRMQEHADAATGNKRKALHLGIQAAQGSLILTTDADCTVGSRWIRTMVRSFTPETGFVAGPVRYRPGPTLFGKLQALEFLALVATGAGGIGLGTPNMCNSANVGYRRKVYDQCGASDDATNAPAADEILAQRLAAETSWHVRFCAHPDALVETDPLLEPSAFWAQRKRWAATGPRYPSPRLAAVVVGVYAFYVLLFAALLALVLAPALWPFVIAALLLKGAADAALLYPACAQFGQRRLFPLFLPEQPLHILYVVGIGASAALWPPRWKGRTVSP